ncbi:MAG: class I SAM-dependent DNA methyltransferase [Pseudomonadota bacterium]
MNQISGSSNTGKKHAIFSDYGQYYDLLYGDKNYVEEVSYITNLLHRIGVRSGKILEFGSGTGRHGRLLGEQGFSVVGIERSPVMASRAVLTESFKCLVGDACTTKVNDKFDAVLALFHVVSYQISNESLLQLFENASAHLSPNGFFIFDVWYSPAVGKNIPEARIKKAFNENLKVTRFAQPRLKADSNQVDVEYEIIVQDRLTGKVETTEETHSMRHFSTPEIDLIGKLTDFKIVCAEEFMTGNLPGFDTWGVCYVLKKIQHTPLNT